MAQLKLGDRQFADNAISLLGSIKNGETMPKNAPLPDQIINRGVSFFSVDTNVLEGKGFSFKKGALNVLHQQLPNWMTLKLSDIVEREVNGHRMRDLEEAKQKLDIAVNHMQRKAALNVTKVQAALTSLSIIESGRKQFDAELQAFVSGLGGEILPTTGETLTRDLFDRYFAKRPPFEVLKDKKSEFPDAAVLLVLEQFAKDQETCGVLISKDKGWQSFANDSEHLFCVKTLEEFTALFAAMSAHSTALLVKVRAALEDRDSSCYELVKDAVNDHVSDAEWSVDELYSSYAHRMEGESNDSSVVTIQPDFKNMTGWFTDVDRPLYVVELPISISVVIMVSVTFYQWDSIDHDEMNMGSQDIDVPMDIDVSVFLTSSGELMEWPVDDWDMEVEIASGKYSVDVGEVNLDYGESDDYDPDEHYGQETNSSAVEENFDDKAKSQS